MKVKKIINKIQKQKLKKIRKTKLHFIRPFPVVSFEVQFGDHFRSGDHLQSGSFAALYRANVLKVTIAASFVSPVIKNSPGRCIQIV